MKRVIFPAFLLGFIALLSGATQPFPPPRKITAEEARASYPAIKVAMRSWAGRGGLIPHFYMEDHPMEGRPRKMIGLFYCSTNNETWDHVSIVERPYVDLANDVVMIEQLKTVGYYDRVFEGPLREYEKDVLARIAVIKNVEPDMPLSSDRIVRRLSEQMFTEIEKNRRKIQPRAAELAGDAECGDGESPYYLRPQPSPARIWITTQFRQDLCRAQKKDPWDIRTCQWREVDPSQAEELSGTYAYQAKWPDGRARRGNRSFEPYDAMAPAKIVYIKPQ